MERSKITSHILDVEKGKPASGVAVTLARMNGEKWDHVASGITDQDGRVGKWIEKEVVTGHFKISFGVKEYFSSQNRECFYPAVSIEFYLNDLNQHYHVPLLLSAHGYSTYRGS